MSGLIAGVVAKLFERLWKWSQSPEGQKQLRKFFAAIRKALETEGEEQP